MKYQLYREQQLQCDLPAAWNFFSSANNLALITPPALNFKVKTNLKSNEIYEGMLIDYTVTPLLGIPLKWRTKITQVDFQRSFTDFQVNGPYKLWNHHHEFEANANGVLVKDTVTYQLPFGLLGQLAHGILVRPKLKEIFDFRQKVLAKMFNRPKN